MTDAEIFDILKRLLREEIGVNFDLKLDTGLFKEKLIDSMEWLSYVVRVEERFGIEISDADGDEFQLGIMGNMVHYIHARLNPK